MALVKRLLLVLSAVLLAISATSCGSNGSSGGSASAAVVNGSTITMDQLTAQLDGIATFLGAPDNMANEQRQVVYTEGSTNYSTTFVSSVLTSMIQSQLVRDEAAARGITASASDTQSAEQALQQQLGQSPGELPDAVRQDLIEVSALQAALGQALQQEAPTTEVTDEDVRAYYDQNIADIVAKSGDFACVSHILIGWTENPDPDAQVAAPTDEQKASALVRANDVESQLAAGADFGQLAAQYSVDPGSKDAGGNLGCVPKGSGLVQSFEDAAFSQPVGEIGQPVESDFGYHIISVRSRGVPPFEELGSSIRTYLEQQATSSTDPTQAWLSEALGSADVEINAQIGTWDSKGGVVPPEGASTQTTVGGDPSAADVPIDLSQLTGSGG